MNPRRLARGITALLFAILLGGYVHHDEVRWSQRGLDAFLQHETARYMKSMQPPHSIFLSIFVSGIFGLLILWLYEAVIWAVAKLWKQPTA